MIDGASIVGQTGARLRETRCGIGMIFQHFNLWNAKTVYDNVAFPLKCARWSKQDIEERVVELLEFVNLEEKRDAYPQTLSGGQKQRVAIARALARQHAHPPVRRAHQRARSRNHKIGARRAETREPATWRDHRGHHPRA